MSRVAGAVLALVALAGLAACRSSDADYDSLFSEFTAPDAHFTARFPGEPERRDVPQGDRTMVLYQSHAGGIVHMVGWVRLDGVPREDEALDAMEEARDRFLRSADGRQDGSYSTRHGSAPALDFKGSLPDDVALQARLLVSGRDMYLVQVMGQRSSDLVPDFFEQFAESFLVLPA